MRIERLQFIADRCPQLRVEALKMALSFVQRTFNVDVYEEIHRKLSEAARYHTFDVFHVFWVFHSFSFICISTPGLLKAPL